MRQDPPDEALGRCHRPWGDLRGNVDITLDGPWPFDAVADRDDGSSHVDRPDPAGEPRRSERRAERDTLPGRRPDVVRRETADTSLSASRQFGNPFGELSDRSAGDAATPFVLDACWSNARSTSATMSTGSTSSSNTVADTSVAPIDSPGGCRPIDSIAQATTGMPSIDHVERLVRGGIPSTIDVPDGNARGTARPGSGRWRRRRSRHARRVPRARRTSVLVPAHGHQPPARPVVDQHGRRDRRGRRSSEWRRPLSSGPLRPVTSIRCRVLPGGNIATRGRRRRRPPVRHGPGRERRRRLRSSRSDAIRTSAAATSRPGRVAVERRRRGWWSGELESDAVAAPVSLLVHVAAPGWAKV